MSEERSSAQLDIKYCGADEFPGLHGKRVCLSGVFARQSKSAVGELIKRRGGIVADHVSSNTDILLVGQYSNAAWKYGNYGTKIESAVRLQKQGCSILILKEQDFYSALEKTDSALRKSETEADECRKVLAELNARKELVQTELRNAEEAGQAKASEAAELEQKLRGEETKRDALRLEAGKQAKAKAELQKKVDRSNAEIEDLKKKNGNYRAEQDRLFAFAFKRKQDLKTLIEENERRIIEKKYELGEISLQLARQLNDERTAAEAAQAEKTVSALQAELSAARQEQHRLEQPVQELRREADEIEAGIQRENSRLAELRKAKEAEPVPEKRPEEEEEEKEEKEEEEALSVSETVLLLQAVVDYLNGKITVNAALQDVSDGLRALAVSAGKEIDDSYRSIQEVSYHFSRMVLAYKEIRTETEEPPIFTEVVKIYKTDRRRFEALLQNAAAQTPEMPDPDDEPAEDPGSAPASAAAPVALNKAEEQKAKEDFVNWLVKTKAIRYSEAMRFYMPFLNLANVYASTRLHGVSIYASDKSALEKDLAALREDAAFQAKDERVKSSCWCVLDLFAEFRKVSISYESNADGALIIED